MMDATTGTTGSAAADSGDGLSKPTIYRCTTCLTDFESNTFRREHMKNDWQ